MSTQIEDLRVEGAGPALARELVTRLQRVRQFEEAAKEVFDRGLVRGAIHLCVGQEATVVGACAALAADDYITGNHRSHGHPIAKGARLGPLMAELLGRSTGVCRGKGGSMHLADFSVGSLGESGIVAGSIPIAVGAALTSQVRGDGRVAMAFFGDGATSEGVFHESMNIAMLWSLPVVFLCENNQYAATVPLDEMTPSGDISRRALGYGMPGVTVDGQDVLAVRAAATVAVDRARAGGGPTLINAETYRFYEHAYRLPIRMPYRPVAEVEFWRDHRDPVRLFEQRAIDEGWLSTGDIQEITAEVRDEVTATVRFAEESPDPVAADAFSDLFVVAS